MVGMTPSARVRDYMTPTVHSVGREQKLAVARKIGAALIARDGHAIGVLTTIDALRALVDALDELGRIAANGKNSEVRA